MSRPGPERVASLLLTIDRGSAAELLKRLPDHERRAVTQALSRLADGYIDRPTQEQLLREFRGRIRAMDGFTPDAAEIQQLLSQALGREGASLTQQLTAQDRHGRARATLARLDGASLSFVLQGEHPQAIAVILMELGPEASSGALPRFSEAMQQDLVTRMVGMQKPTGEFVTLLLEAAVDKAKTLEDTGGSVPEGDKLKQVAAILNKFKDEQRQLLMMNVEMNDPERAQKVKDQMFTFEDLLKLGPKDIQRILSGIDTKVLATALKGASPALSEFISSNISKRTQERVQEERETMGAIRLSEVQKAQLEMATVARDLIGRGEIQYGGGDDELVS